ncbi:MAG: SurA N-terminal domain-containing protein [Chitinophagaceae bacterium]|nr:SurA N-terminal domain-containing protein [Chitinophagaceae bacterium]
MSVIQNIQEKYAKLMAIIIALALIIFVVMLAFENGGNLFGGGNTTTVGKVNGKSISYNDFLLKVDQQEKYMESQRYGTGPMLRQQAIEGAWNQEINSILQNEEYDELGIEVGKKEMGDILYGMNPPEDLKRQFTDSATGTYNGQLAKSKIDEVLKMKKGTAEQLESRERLIQFITYLENNRLSEKYSALLTNSYNVPKWLVEKENADKSQMATISLVREAYATNTDSSIRVTDKEIEDYINKHKDEYKQKDETRSIAYVLFKVAPSAADTAVALNRIMGLRAEFDTTKEVKKFLEKQGAQMYDGYITGSQIQIPVKDSIFRLPIGGVYGPYIDANNYALGKLLGARTIPDTVKARHILISLERRDPQSGEILEQRDSATARRLIDSVQRLVRNGANFDSLVVAISEDGGSKTKGGVYDVPSGQFVSEFNDFIFTNPTGSKGVVKTEFGYHYIEILSQKGSSPGYKAAYLTQPIEVSPETENTANSEASLFAGDSRDQKSFDANVEKLRSKGISKNFATDITNMASDVQGVGFSRDLVKAVFKADKGDVIEPIKVDDNYVVAIVTDVVKPGLLPIAKARSGVEPLLRNKKIADVLRKKIGNVTTLEAAATALGGRQVEVADSVRMVGGQTSPSAGYLSGEPKVVGATFNPANRGKVVTEVIDGTYGVYVIRVDNVIATPLAEANVPEQRKLRYQQGRQAGMYKALQALRDNANVKDQRNDFF